MDDAILNVGGRLLNRRGLCCFTIVSMTRWSNFTSYLTHGRDFMNVQEISDLRRQESELAARLLGGEFHSLEWSEAPLRFWPSERWSPAIAEKYKHDPYMFWYRMPSPRDVRVLAEQLSQTLAVREPDELWIPLGLSNHVDHRTTRSVCLLMLVEERRRFSAIPVSIYEDIPSVATYGHGPEIRVALAEYGTRLVRTTEDITDVFEEKLRAISVYASQFKMSYIEPIVRGVAEQEAIATGRLAEAFYRVEGEVHLPPESRLSRESAGLMALESGVRTLVTNRTKHRRITVMALPFGSLGQWESDSKSLRAAFPNADLLVYVSEDIAWLAEEIGDDKLRLELVRGRWGWVAVIWHEFLRFRTPTVVLWRGAYASAPRSKVKKLINFFLKSLLPFRRVLFARNLWDFCCVMNEQLEGSGAEVRRPGAAGG